MCVWGGGVHGVRHWQGIGGMGAPDVPVLTSKRGWLQGGAPAVEGGHTKRSKGATLPAPTQPCTVAGTAAEKMREGGDALRLVKATHSAVVLTAMGAPPTASPM